MLKRLAAFTAVCVSLLSLAARAQDVFVLPGSTSSTSTVLPFSGQYVAIGSGFTAGTAAFQVFAKPNGTEYYIVSASNNQTVTTVDPGFQSPKSLANLGAPATAAALTADGKYLLVIAGGALYIFNTATDTQVNTTGITPAGGPIVDMALSLDGSQAFVLSTATTSAGTAQGTLYSVNPATGAISSTNLVINNILNGVAVGPNDLVYVSGVNRIYEVNPATLALTSGGEIALNGTAGKPGFTPDGRYAVVPNKAPGVNGAAVVLIDLVAHDVATTGANLGNAIIDKILVPSSSVAYGYSSNTGSVYVFTIPNLNVSGINFAGVPTLNIMAIALSEESAEGANVTPAATTSSPKTAHYLYLVASGDIYRIDLTTNQLSGQLPVSIQQPAAISVTGPAITGSSPVSVLQYGSKQNVALGGVSEPLVLRALDVNGNPLSGVPVTFATTSAGVKVSNPSVATGANGYALTTITATSTNEQITVTATAGTQTLTFGVTAGAVTTGGSGGTQAGSLTITSGQGQIFLAGFGSSAGNGQPLTVEATDANGKPLPGVKVTFEPSANNLNANPGAAGSLGLATVGTDDGATSDGFGRIVTTNAMGLAGVNFQPNAEVSFSLIQSSFVASSPNVNSVTFYVTVAPSTGSPAVRSSLLSGSAITGQSGATVKGAVSIAVATEQGTPIPDVFIQAIVPPVAVGQTGPTGTLQTLQPSPVASCATAAGTSVLTDQSGNATCDLVIKASPGTYQFSINVGNYIVQGPYNLKVLPGAPTTAQILSGNNQTGAPGQALQPFVVQVNDAGGNPLAGQPVSFQISTGGSIVLSSVSATTDASGKASAVGTLGTTAGTYQLVVTAGGTGGPSATFTYTIAVPVSAIAATSGNNQMVAESMAFASPLIVTVTDANGNPVSGITVTFSASNGAVLSTSSATTGTNGQASTTVTAGPAAGTITVTASAPGGLITSFTLTATPPGPSNITFLNGASFQPGIAPGAIAVINGTNLLPGFSGLYNALGIVGPLPTSITTGALAGLSITFNGVAAPIFYASNQNGQEQVAVQVPYEVTAGTATVVINTPEGGTSQPLKVPIQAAAPGIFQTEYNGMSYTVAIRESDGSYISPTNPAHIGDTICVFATGLGQTTPMLATNSTGVANATLVYPIDVGLDNAGVRLVSAAPSQDQVGVFTVCMAVPTGTVTGSRQPVGIVVHTNPGVSKGDFFGNSTYIPIQ